MSVVVIMPPLAESQERHPEAIPGGVVSGKPPRSPHMSSRIHEPGGVEAEDSTKEDAPQ